MEQVADAVRDMVSSGCTLSQVVQYLREEVQFELTPFNLLRVFHEALGASLTDVRPLITPFDADMKPLLAVSETDRIGEGVFASYRA